MNNKQRKIAYLTQNPDLCLESPIERVVYNALKTAGLCPVMQYPLDKYWIDFAFPEYKIAIEYDGKQHLNRQLEDEKRDEDIRSMGWEVYRLTKFDLGHFKDEEGEDKMRMELFFDRLKKRLRKTPEEVVYEENELEKSY